MKFNTATPYIASYVIIHNQEGKVAFVLRSHTKWMNGHYGLPSGKVEKNESYTQAAIREAKEEIGITVAAKDVKHVLTMHRYDVESSNPDWVDLYFTVDTWQGEPYNAEPHVHSELAWLDPDKLPTNTISAVKYAFEQIKAGHVYAEYGFSA
jgi:8-oxo-dGTP pyrophosphatase MutT (NUDIX family)